MVFTEEDECATEEARELMGEIGRSGMGYLFENMEKMTFRLKDEIHREKRNARIRRKKKSTK